MEWNVSFMAQRQPEPYHTVVTTEPKPGDRVTQKFLQQSRQYRDEEQKKILKDLVVVSIRGGPPLRVMLTQPANDAFVKATFVDKHDCATERDHFRKEDVSIISGGGTSEVVAQCRAASRQQSAESPANTPSEPADATAAARSPTLPRTATRSSCSTSRPARSGASTGAAG